MRSRLTTDEAHQSILTKAIAKKALHGQLAELKKISELLAKIEAASMAKEPPLIRERRAY